MSDEYKHNFVVEYYYDKRLREKFNYPMCYKKTYFDTDDNVQNAIVMEMQNDAIVEADAILDGTFVLFHVTREGLKKQQALMENRIDKTKEFECTNDSCHKKIKYGDPIWIDYNESCVFCSAECYADNFGATKFELGQHEDDVDYNSFFVDIAEEKKDDRS